MAPPESDPAQWLGRAGADLRTAELVLGDPVLPSWVAGFHLQQAAEKSLKAVLAASGRAPPRTHDLVLLAELAETLEPGFAGRADRLLALGEFAVAHRYPGAPVPRLDLGAMVAEVRELLAAAERACRPR